MARSRRPGPAPASAPDATPGWHPARGYLAVALIVAIGVPGAWLLFPAPSAGTADGLVVRPMPPRSAPPHAAPAALAASAGGVAPAVATLPVRAVAATRIAALPPARSRDPDGDPTPDLGDYLNPGEAPPMAEVIARLHAAGVTGGLGAFQPPGTRPPLVGLAVPDDYVLPEGYVRHHQATDDGQRIEPILMYSPDYRWYDAAGRPVALPPDRVVPLEHAPPGLPLRRIVLPAPAEPGK